MRFLIQSVMRLRRNGYSGPFFIGLMLFVCGVQLLIPNDTFVTSISYDVMGEWASEEAWGVFFIACSSFIIISSVKRKPEMVAVGALVAGFGWLVTWVSVLLGNPEGLLMPIVGVLTVRCVSLFREFTERQSDPHLTGPWSNADDYPASS